MGTKGELMGSIFRINFDRFLEINKTLDKTIFYTEDNSRFDLYFLLDGSVISSRKLKSEIDNIPAFRTNTFPRARSVLCETISDTGKSIDILKSLGIKKTPTQKGAKEFYIDYNNFIRLRNNGKMVTFYTESLTRFILYFSLDNFIIKTVKTKEELLNDNIPIGTYREQLRGNNIWRVEERPAEEEELPKPEEYTLKQVNPFDSYNTVKFVGWDLHNIRYWMLTFLETYDFPKITNITDKEKKILKEILIDAIKSSIPLNIMEERLDELFDDKVKVERVLRTEMNVIANESALDRYKAKGIKRVRWLATIDNRTSEICREGHGKVFKIEDARGILPAHVNCRSVWVPLVE